MTLKQTINRREFNVLHIIIVLTLLQLFITLFTNGFAFSGDEAMWHYIGRNWFRNGLIPYTGGTDNKSPLIFAIFGLSDKLFGINYWFPRVLGTVCQSVGIYYIYKIADKLAGKQAGILAVSFYGLSVLWRGADGRYVSFTETYEVMFIILSFYFFISSADKKGFFISGFVAALGLGFRLSAVFSILTLFIASFHKKWISTIMFCLGVLSGILLLALAGFLAGINLKDIYTYSFADNFGSGSTTDHDFWWRMTQFYDMFFLSELILFYPLVLVYLYIKRKVDWLILWLIFVFIGINILGNYARVDIKDILPAMSLIGAIVIAHLIDKYNVSMSFVMLIIWICFFPKQVEPLLNVQAAFTKDPTNPVNFCNDPAVPLNEDANKHLGWWVKANTGVHDKVFVAGYGSQVQVYSERISPSIYFNATQTAIAKKRFYSDMKQNKPDMILVPLFREYKQYIGADLRSYVDSLVEKDYNYDRCIYNYAVYKIKK